MIIAECLLIKNENQYLSEHLQTNARAGIDFFYIYDNCSIEPVKEFLQRCLPGFVPRCHVETISGANLQLYCYKKFLHDYGAEVDYVFFIDTDEILEGNIKAAAEKYSYAGALIFAPVLHGCNGHIYDNGGGMVARFRDDVIRRRDSWTKCLVKPGAVIRQDVHTTQLRPGFVPQYLSALSFPDAVLHHYRFRSLEEYIKKILRGSCDARALFNLKSFFDDNKSIAPDSPDVQQLLKKYGVTLQTTQNKPQ